MNQDSVVGLVDRISMVRCPSPLHPVESATGSDAIRLLNVYGAYFPVLYATGT